MTYRLDLRDHQQYRAVRDRYALDHPDYDSEQHVLVYAQIDGFTWEITRHRDKDPAQEAAFATALDRCCCHPDQPAGHEITERKQARP